MRRGLYRIHGVGGLPDDVRIEDDGIETPVEESLYRSRGYQPAVEELLWKEDYDRVNARPRDGQAKALSDKFAREQAREEFRAGLRKG